MNIIPLDVRQTIIIAILVLYLGKYLSRQFKFLQSFNIPEAVSGGTLVSLLLGLCHSILQLQLNFDLSIRDAFLIVFFTTIGLSSKLKTLLQGGKPLLILLTVAIGFLAVQNLTGVIVSSILGLKLLIGLLGGSISLSGGHGTVIAWAPIFKESYGIASASEIGVASATFGLVLGGVIGGPIAKGLITRNHLTQANQEQALTIGIKNEPRNVKIDYDTMLHSIFVIAIAIGLGLEINMITAAIGLKLPLFVTCLLAGIFLTNTMPSLFKRYPWPGNTPSMALLSEVSLGLFLAISLMSLQLWTLVELGAPLAILLLVQLIVVTAYTIFLVFPVMGRNYDAAVISAGYAGLALGATPTAIANMTAVTQQFGASPQAFIIVPLVGAFFIDIANAFIIQHFLNVIG